MKTLVITNDYPPKKGGISTYIKSFEDNLEFDQLILEYYSPSDGSKGWVHCSYNEKGSNRKQVLKALAN